MLVQENTSIKTLGGIKWSKPYLVMDGSRASVSIYCRTSTSGETAHQLDISSVCTNNCSVRFGVTAKGRTYTLHIQNTNTGAEAPFDLSAIVAEYKDRNQGEV
jgi:hypothetical protein